MIFCKILREKIVVNSRIFGLLFFISYKERATIKSRNQRWVLENPALPGFFNQNYRYIFLVITSYPIKIKGELYVNGFMSYNHSYKQTKRQTEITTLYVEIQLHLENFFSLKSPNTQIRTFRKKHFRGSTEFPKRNLRQIVLKVPEFIVTNP